MRRPVGHGAATRLATGFALAALVLVAPERVRADEPAREQSFQSANAAFAEGRFDDARATFARLADGGAASPAVLYNLGNAAFRAGKPGEAILAYERALLAAPRDQDVHANLRQVRKAAGLDQPERGPWTRLAQTVTTDAWAWLASIGVWLGCLALLARRVVTAEPAARSLRSALAAAGATGFAIVLVAAAACATRLGERDRGVVLDGDPKLRVAPYASASVSSELLPGEIVRIERTHEGFTLVRSPGGRSGWIADGAVGRVR